jgi:GMP synthase-like glutamine amidotransferase
MAVLICKNIEHEGPGTIEDYLRTQKFPYEIIDLSRGEKIPDHERFEVLILMGGPMSVQEENLYPYLQREGELVKDFLKRKRKILGICLGAQIMAKALGARVYKGKDQEIGWDNIELTEEGSRDPFMQALAFDPDTGDFSRKFKVFHWHGETFNIPRGAEKLAESDLYPEQAFRYGNRAYALQFHIEVQKKMIYDWFRDKPSQLITLTKQTEQFYDVYQKRAFMFYELFFSSKT